MPKDLQEIVGKPELRTPLGGDRREALKLHPGAVADLQRQIAPAGCKANRARHDAPVVRHPLTPDQIAQSHYMQRLAFDDELRNDPRWPSIGIDDVLVYRLRMATGNDSFLLSQNKNGRVQ